MANLILPGGPRRGVVRPTGPFLMNRDSAQTQKLAGWWPMTGWSGLRGMGRQPLDIIPQLAFLPNTPMPDAGLVTTFNQFGWGNTNVVPYSASGTTPFSMSFWYYSLQNLGTNLTTIPWVTTETGSQTDPTRDKGFRVIPNTGHMQFYVARRQRDTHIAESTMKM